jgi:hypothetical protein
VDVGEFWGLIERAVRDHPDVDARSDWLQAQLSACATDDILDFEAHLDDASDRAMTWLMWGAAYRILGGCSDDGFCDFRTWLMSLGRQTFERVVDDPDALAELPQVSRLAGRERADWTPAEWPGWEGLNYVASEAFEGVRGEGANIYRAVEEHRARPRPATLQDEDWHFDDPAETARRLPRLTGLFPSSDAQRTARLHAELAAQGRRPADFYFGGPAPGRPDGGQPPDGIEIPGQLTIPGLPERPRPGLGGSWRHGATAAPHDMNRSSRGIPPGDADDEEDMR